MRVTIVDNGSTYLPRLVALSGPSVDVISRLEAEDILPTLEEGLVILSGGHGLPVVDKPAEYVAELNFLKTTELPVLGVCLGFELLVMAHGGRLGLLPGRERGLLDIAVVVDDPIFQGVTKYRVFENHRWVATDLGSELIGLARSKDGFEIIRHKQKPQHGFQFHPEMFEKSKDGVELFKRFRQRLTG